MEGGREGGREGERGMDRVGEREGWREGGKEECSINGVWVFYIYSAENNIMRTDIRGLQKC